MSSPDIQRDEMTSDADRLLRAASSWWVVVEGVPTAPVNLPGLRRLIAAIEAEARRSIRAKVEELPILIAGQKNGRPNEALSRAAILNLLGADDEQP